MEHGLEHTRILSDNLAGSQESLENWQKIVGSRKGVAVFLVDPGGVPRGPRDSRGQRDPCLDSRLAMIIGRHGGNV